jgi:hypothetical protein
MNTPRPNTDHATPDTEAPARSPKGKLPDPLEPGHEKDSAHIDSPLESLGKAISDPVKSAAEDEEPGPDGQPRVRPGG